MATPFVRGDQSGWEHHHPAGTFHTFDRFFVGGLAPRKLHVFVPRGIGPFPVLYFHDGDTTFWRGGVGNDTWDVAGAVQARPDRVAIVVAICPIDRNEEYTHVDWSHGQRSWGGLARHAAWLAGPVKSWIDRWYPTRPSPPSTGVVGASHGALASFWTATRHPDRFGMAGCLSPSFFSGLDSLTWGSAPVRLAAAPLVADVVDVLSDPSRRPKLWISWGLRRDGGDHNRVVEALASLRGAEMIEILVEHGYRRQTIRDDDAPDPRSELYTYVDVHGGHTEAAWRHQVGWVIDAFVQGR